MRSLLPWIAVSSLATGAAAQQVIETYQLHHSSGTWTTGTAVDEFKNLAVLHMTSAIDADVVFVRHNELQLAAGVAARDNVRRLSANVTDCLVLPALGPNQTDLLLTTGPTDIGNPGGVQTWSSSGGALPTPSPVTSLPSSWAGARLLRLDADGVMYAVNAAGTSILRTTVPGFGPRSSLTVSGVKDLRPIDFDNDGDDELAVLTGSSLTVYDSSLSVVFSTYAWGAYDQIAVSRGQGTESDYLFYSFAIYNIPYYAVLFSGHTEPLASLAHLAAGFCTSLSSFQFDTDSASIGRQDVLFTASGSRDVFLYRRQAAEPLFVVTNPCQFELDGGSIQSSPYPTRVAGGDVDGDGDQDLVFALHHGDELRTALNGRMERYDFGLWIGPVAFKWNTRTITLNYSLGPAVGPGVTGIDYEWRVITPIYSGGQAIGFQPAVDLIGTGVFPAPSTWTDHQDLAIPTVGPLINGQQQVITPDSLFQFIFHVRQGAVQLPAITLFASTNDAAETMIESLEANGQYLGFYHEPDGAGNVAPGTLGGGGLGPQRP